MNQDDFARLDFAGKHGEVHIEAGLTNLSFMYTQDIAGTFVADELFPRTPSGKQYDKYYVFGRQHQNVLDNLVKPGQTFPTVKSWAVESTPNFFCEQRGLKDEVTDIDTENADPAVDPATSTTYGLTFMQLLAREARVTAIADNWDTYATSGNRIALTGAERWNDSGFTPTGTYAIRKVIDRAKRTVRSVTGQLPNMIIMGVHTAQVVARDPYVLKLIRYTDPSLLVNGDLPPVLWNMKVCIAGAIANTANLGQAFSAGDVWGPDVLLVYRNPVIGKKMMSYGLTFQYKPYTMISWRDPDVSTQKTWYGGSDFLDEKLTSEFCGYFIKDAIDPNQD